jgi:hypothetical protein
MYNFNKKSVYYSLTKPQQFIKKYSVNNVDALGFKYHYHCRIEMWFTNNQLGRRTAKLLWYILSCYSCFIYFTNNQVIIHIYSHLLKYKSSEYSVYNGKRQSLYLNFSNKGDFCVFALIFIEYDFMSLNHDVFMLSVPLYRLFPSNLFGTFSELVPFSTGASLVCLKIFSHLRQKLQKKSVWQ